MSFLTRLFRPHIELAPPLAARLQIWRELPGVNERTDLSRARFVSVDVETSGLNPRRDRLLSIGAVAVQNGRLRPGDGFDATVQNAVPSARDNILVHGIGIDAQAGGMPADEALMGFLEVARHDILVGFHADFDRAVLERAAREQLGVRLPNLWLDVARLAPILVPEARLAGKSLDDWLGYFGLRVHTRHSAAYDAFATAELLLILLSRAGRAGFATLGQVLAAGERRERLLS